MQAAAFSISPSPRLHCLHILLQTHTTSMCFSAFCALLLIVEFSYNLYLAMCTNPAIGAGPRRRSPPVLPPMTPSPPPLPPAIAHLISPEDCITGFATVSWRFSLCSKPAKSTSSAQRMQNIQNTNSLFRQKFKSNLCDWTFFCE